MSKQKKQKTVERELNDLLLTYVYVKKVDLLKKKVVFLEITLRLVL